ncbi:LysR family transcriptional regulator [Vibrio plantisponsor]|uniref:LysR family transcriptional regulator n=1 Tax=Vibrio plantisponsor TaxID=664643 RepID=A0ABU4INI8_9VIBR|nr:LysR family transcriptional regulator [Vibrio plantisponsor]MDW6020133.1 LysR family transcriptional regulator [Vibrio plantisponsor]NNM40966.1 LysR family transcriptional regulator [Vibrio plantisponsor]
MLSSQDIEFFITVAGSRSLAAAARKLNVTPPSVSQRLQNIERKLGVKLIDRNARITSLTTEGEVLASKGQALLQDLEHLTQDLSEKKLAISGDLKLVSSLGFGEKHIGPLAAEFQQLYPSLRIELNLSDIPKWSAHNSPDIMFYIGHLQDSALKRIVLSKNRRLLLASPAYLESAPVLEQPKDLEQHRCIALRENDEDATMWRLTHTTTKCETSVRVVPVLSSNVSRVTKDWCIDGQGIIQRSEWDVQEELKSGKLVRVLADYQLQEADIVALLSSEQFHRSQKVTAFLDHVKQRLPERLSTR